MDLRINRIENKGEKGPEAIWIEVLADVKSLSHYAVCDTTYTDDHRISNELRHIFWFSNTEVKAGDWIKLATGSGSNTSFANQGGTTTHVFHWKLGSTVWNKDSDCAVLMYIADWSTHRG